MKHPFLCRITAVLLCFGMAFSLASCSRIKEMARTILENLESKEETSSPIDLPESETEDSAPPETTPASEPEDTQPIETIDPPEYDENALEALLLLRKYMDTMPQAAMAAAYLGYREQNDETPLADWLINSMPGLMEKMPFILTIPEDRILGKGYGDLYCLVPRDDSTSLSVNHVTWSSNEAGVWPEADEILYRDEYAKPVLVFVGFDEFRDEPDIGIHAIAGNGATVEWYPFINKEYGCILLPTGEDDCSLLFDFTRLGDTTELENENDGWEWEPSETEEWLPPTDEGLAETCWNCGNGWEMELVRGDGAQGYSGITLLYYQTDDAHPFEILYTGSWRMEDDCLRLEMAGSSSSETVSGSFPVLIDLSGENLFIQQSREGVTCPPFFYGEVTSMVLKLVNG